MDYKDLAESRSRRSEELTSETSLLYEELSTLSDVNDTLNSTREELLAEVSALEERKVELQEIVAEAEEMVQAMEVLRGGRTHFNINAGWKVCLFLGQ